MTLREHGRLLARDERGGHEPDWRTPGTEDVPIHEPGDNPDVETEL